jgi:hypothetical protein
MLVCGCSVQRWETTVKGRSAAESVTEMLARLCQVLVVGLLVVPAAQATGLGPRQLLARYEPVVVLDPEEPFRPEPVDGFLADAALEQLLPDGSWRSSGPPAPPLPRADPAGCTSSDKVACWRLNVPSCTPADGVASVTCYASLDAARPEAPAVYGGLLRDGKRIALEYWYWYPYDFWSGQDPPSDFAWTAHEGDWEAVSVVLDATQRPLLAAYSQHTCGKRRAWARVPKWRHSTHPVVYVALGSHSNSFSPQPYPIDLRPQCYPPLGAAILAAQLHPPLDRTGPGTTIGPRLPRVHAAPVIRLTNTSPAWMSFPGRWGEANYFHAQGLNTVIAGPAPAGPRFHALWQHPTKTIFAWPPG